MSEREHTLTEDCWCGPTEGWDDEGRYLMHHDPSGEHPDPPDAKAARAAGWGEFVVPDHEGPT